MWKNWIGFEIINCFHLHIKIRTYKLEYLWLSGLRRRAHRIFQWGRTETVIKENLPRTITQKSCIYITIRQFSVCFVKRFFFLTRPILRNQSMQNSHVEVGKYWRHHQNFPKVLNSQFPNSTNYFCARWILCTYYACVITWLVEQNSIKLYTVWTLSKPPILKKFKCVMNEC